MTVEPIRKFLEAQRFRPFVMHLAEGRQVPVNHREFVMSSPGGRTLPVYQPDDTLKVIDLLRVTDPDIKPVANGAGRRRKASR
jgi:hypothetical protein